MAAAVFNKNNVLAGGFLVAGVILAVWVSFMLKDKSPYRHVNTFTVRFGLADGASGLKRGSPVLLGGQEVGRVTKVGFAGKDGPPGTTLVDSVDVDVEVRADLAMNKDAQVFIERPLLGTLSTINITSPGKGAPLGPGDVIAGGIAPPAFLAQAGFGAEQGQQLRAAISGMSGAVEKIAAMIDRSGPQAEAALTDVRDAVKEIRANLAEWSKKIDGTLENVAKASERIDPLMTKVDRDLDTANAAVTDVRELIAANRVKIDSIITNVEDATGKIDKEMMESLDSALKSGQKSLASFSGAIDKLGTIITGETPNLRRVMANLRLMSDQLKLTAIEVRSQPWRLLVQPTQKETEAQVLYDATRSYAQASSDLRAASESLEAAAASGAKLTADRESLEDLSKRLAEAVEKYRGAEQALLEKLIGKR